MADNTSADSSKGVKQERFEYSDEFSRIVFILDEINRAESSGSKYLNHNKPFLASYIPRVQFRPDFIKCFHDLPDEFSFLDEEYRAVQSGQGRKDDSKPRKPPIRRSSLLLLLGELRKCLESGAIDPSARLDILNLFLNITGPRRDVINRVLFYLYPPPGPFAPKEEPGSPSTLGDARRIYPTENLVFSLRYTTQVKMERNEYRRYLSSWGKVRQRFEVGMYSKADSMATWRKLSKAFSAYKDLMRLLGKIPWPHLTDGSALGPPSTSKKRAALRSPSTPGKRAALRSPSTPVKRAAIRSPSTPTRKSSTDKKISGRRT